MKFIDEAQITVISGKGGDGCLSFRREKFVPKGGPDGGDGGKGGSVYLQATPHQNTLFALRYKRHFEAGSGQAGMGNQCSGKQGDDLCIQVPLGTVVYDLGTSEQLGELVNPDQSLCVAQGGKRGLGNIHFKSSIQRAPRKTIPGTPGEKRMLRLELQVLADVGLLGMPNAGKSTLVRSVSSAHPKVADYPFTTLRPHLGVVSIGCDQSFVIADLPGLISGAAEGAGLGDRFLKHMLRTKLLLHVIDLTPFEEHDPLDDAQAIIEELTKYNPNLANKPRWLVLNKIDLLTPAQQSEITTHLISGLNFQDRVFPISAIQKQGTQALCFEIMRYLTPLPCPIDIL